MGSSTTERTGAADYSTGNTTADLASTAGHRTGDNAIESLRTADSTTGSSTAVESNTGDYKTGSSTGVTANTGDYNTGSTIGDTTASTETSNVQTGSGDESQRMTEDQPPRTVTSEHDTSKSDTRDISGDDNTQHATQGGDDPSLVGSAEKGRVKMTGTGAPGSHSALFGLTPDGHKETETSSKTTAPKPAHGDDQSKSADVDTDTSDRIPAGEGKGGVESQLNDPRVAEKGHEGKAVESEGTGKPGSGT